MASATSIRPNTIVPNNEGNVRRPPPPAPRPPKIEFNSIPQPVTGTSRGGKRRTNKRKSRKVRKHRKTRKY